MNDLSNVKNVHERLGQIQLVDCREQPRDEGNALLAGAMLLQQEIAQVLLKAVNHSQGGVRVEVGLQFGFLLGLEIVTVVAHQ